MAIVPGKCGKGHSVLVKVEERYYEASLLRKNSLTNWIIYRCKNSYKVDALGNKCKWKGRFRKIIKNGKEDEFHLEVVDNPGADAHNCIPVDPVPITTSNKVRDIIRKAVEDGFRTFEDVKALAGLPEDIYVGERTKYQRLFNKVLRKKTREDIDKNRITKLLE